MYLFTVGGVLKILLKKIIQNIEELIKAPALFERMVDAEKAVLTVYFIGEIMVLKVDARKEED